MIYNIFEKDVPIENIHIRIETFRTDLEQIWRIDIATVETVWYVHYKWKWRIKIDQVKEVHDKNTWSVYTEITKDWKLYVWKEILSLFS